MAADIADMIDLCIKVVGLIADSVASIDTRSGDKASCVSHQRD